MISRPANKEVVSSCDGIKGACMRLLCPNRWFLGSTNEWGPLCGSVLNWVLVFKMFYFTVKWMLCHRIKWTNIQPEWQPGARPQLTPWRSSSDTFLDWHPRCGRCYRSWRWDLRSSSGDSGWWTWTGRGPGGSPGPALLTTRAWFTLCHVTHFPNLTCVIAQSFTLYRVGVAILSGKKTVNIHWASEVTFGKLDINNFAAITQFSISSLL